MVLDCYPVLQRRLSGTDLVSLVTMADLHDNVTYEGWGKSSAAGHREYMGNSKRVLRRSISLLRGKTDCLHMH